jgi:tRNA-2-methylthio-N6-dimethylallyladenosine synthase
MPSNDVTVNNQPRAQSVFIKTYGCQMNVSDTEVVSSILSSSGYKLTNSEDGADVVLLNTCAIRDKAEAKIWGKLQLLKHEQELKKKQKQGSRRVVGLLGCMAERLKDKLLDSGMVDVIAGGSPF